MTLSYGLTKPWVGFSEAYTAFEGAQASQHLYFLSFYEEGYLHLITVGLNLGRESSSFHALGTCV